MRELYIDNFIIFEFLGLEYGEIDTNIDIVSFIVVRINTTGHGYRDVTATFQVTEIVTSQSLSRSRVSST